MYLFVLGLGGVVILGQLCYFFDCVDLIFGIGCSFLEIVFGVVMLVYVLIVYVMFDFVDFNKGVFCIDVFVGDVKLILVMLIEVCCVCLMVLCDFGLFMCEIVEVEVWWLVEWWLLLESDDVLFSFYCVLWELQCMVDVVNMIIIYDVGFLCDQLIFFWKMIVLLSYIGWGKIIQFGYGLGLVMGVKIVYFEKLCINVWGDVVIGFIGMDFEIVVCEWLLILLILFNNLVMVIELLIMLIVIECFCVIDILGDYVVFVCVLGGYGEWIIVFDVIGLVIWCGIVVIQVGQLVLFEFIIVCEICVLWL